MCIWNSLICNTYIVVIDWLKNIKFSIIINKCAKIIGENEEKKMLVCTTIIYSTFTLYVLSPPIQYLLYCTPQLSVPTSPHHHQPNPAIPYQIQTHHKFAIMSRSLSCFLNLPPLCTYSYTALFMCVSYFWYHRHMHMSIRE